MPASCTPTPTPIPPRPRQFKEVSRAYEVLCDPEQRARYDRFGEAGVGGAAAGRRPVRRAAGSATCSTRSSAAAARSAAAHRAAAACRPAARPGPRGGRRPHVRAGRVRRHRAGHRAHGAACTDCDGSGAGQGTAAGHLLRVQRRAARCGGCARACSARWSPPSACPRCGGTGQVVVTPCATCGGDGRIIEDRTYQVDVPAGVDTGSTLRLTGRGAVGPRGGPPATCTSTSGWPPTSAIAATATTSSPRCRSPSPRRRSAHASRCRRSTATRSSRSRPARSPAASSSCAAAACRACSGRGRGDLRVRAVVEVPTKLSDDEVELLRRFAEERGELVDPPGQGPVLADQVGVLLSDALPADRASAAAHVFVEPTRDDPVTLDRPTTPPPRAGAAPARRRDVHASATVRGCVALVGRRRRRPAARWPSARRVTVAAARAGDHGRVRPGQGRPAGVDRAEADRDRRRPHRPVRVAPARSCAGAAPRSSTTSSGCARVAREAAMQSRRLRLPDVERRSAFADVLAASRAMRASPSRAAQPPSRIDRARADRPRRRLRPTRAGARRSATVGLRRRCAAGGDRGHRRSAVGARDRTACSR